MQQYHDIPAIQTFATVILPIAIPKPYTYSVPEELVPDLQMGQRVEINFGRNKIYSAIVVEVHTRALDEVKVKPIISILDAEPIVNQQQLDLWRWMADYYVCSLGEVMMAALPAHFKLASETKVVLSPVFDEDYEGLDDKEFMVVEALSIQKELSVEEVRKIVEQKTVYGLLNRLIDKKLIYLEEEIKAKYKPKVIGCVRLPEPYKSDPDLLAGAFDLVQRSEKQQQALLAFITLNKTQKIIRKQDIYKAANVDSSVLNAMQKKGIFELYDKEVSRLGGYTDDLEETHELSAQQVRALAEIDAQKEQKNVILLHGVTGSGKTRVYIELIKKAMEAGEQVLYLLPEVAITAQIIHRLQKIFGDDIATYHHKLNNHERVETWEAVAKGKPVVLGPRSSMFLPYQNLKWVIIDEEHDTSYKQQDPAPRYHGRDAAIYMAHLHKAKVLLGTATPSVESYFNAKKGKYGFVEMPERFGGIKLPKMVIADAKKEQKQRKLQSHFTTTLINELRAALARGEQAILFQNRRGYAPALRCQGCGWTKDCVHCDVTLTYHKFRNHLQCHYCGYHANITKTCPACGSFDLNLSGFGTEKIEDELKIYLPDAKIARMDFDTVKSKNAHSKIINDFEEKRIDVLVGTQMVTKGLDFDNVGLVGVVSADQLFQFPDFRASERGFQLITQVAGRAGRKKKQGLVIVQAMNTDHPVLAEVFDNNYQAFYQREIMERQEFRYPPYSRLIKITLKHKKPDIVNRAAKVFTDHLRKTLGVRVNGPAVPYISRVRNQYLLDVMIKLELDMKVIKGTKKLIREAQHLMQKEAGFSNVRVNVNVDEV